MLTLNVLKCVLLSPNDGYQQKILILEPQSFDSIKKLCPGNVYTKYRNAIIIYSNNTTIHSGNIGVYLEKKFIDGIFSTILIDFLPYSDPNLKYIQKDKFTIALTKKMERKLSNVFNKYQKDRFPSKENTGTLPIKGTPMDIKEEDSSIIIKKSLMDEKVTCRFMLEDDSFIELELSESTFGML